MRFYGNGVVWDPAANRPLARFKNGAIDTDDERTIQQMQALGYEGEGEPPATPPAAPEPEESGEPAQSEPPRAPARPGGNRKRR